MCTPKSDYFQNNFDPVYHSCSPFGCINLEWVENNNGNANLTYADAIDLEMALMRQSLASGVMMHRQEEAARVGTAFQPMTRSSPGTESHPNAMARPTSIHIPPVHEVIFSLLPRAARVHHYGFDPESLLQARHYQQEQSRLNEDARDNGDGYDTVIAHQSRSCQTNGIHTECATPSAQNGYSNGHCENDKHNTAHTQGYNDDNSNSNCDSSSSSSSGSNGSSDDDCSKQTLLGPIGHRRGARHSRNSLSADFHVQAQRSLVPSLQKEKKIRRLSMPEVIEEDDF